MTEASWRPASRQRHRGPFWTVISDAAHGGHPAWQQPQFVSKYELLWRADRGREWHSMGHFRGNTDATSEVAQSFAGIKGGLRARYLRVVRRSSARSQAQRAACGRGTRRQVSIQHRCLSLTVE